jgi:iron complex outermembrane receptor protein
MASLTPGPIDASAFVPEPDFHFGPQTHDHVRQLTVGLAYEGLWTGVGALNLGIQKTAYEKKVTAPTGELPKSSDRPWLFNASLGLQLMPKLMLYSGISRGLEESDVAPAVAINRNEAPPAIRTRQVDAGLRWTVAPAMTLVAGAFRIEKPYYGLDGDRMFRQLGRIRHQGLELSVAGSPLKGLSIVGGAVRLDASVTGDEVQAGRVGRRPVGSSPLTVIASADYRLPAWQALSIDANLQRDSKRIATVDDRLRLPSRALLDLGLRYRLRVLAKPAVLRLQVQNVTNNFSWDVAGSGALQVHQPRQAYAKLSVDF